MKQFISPLVISLVLISVLDRHVKCVPSTKTSDVSTGPSSSARSPPLKDLKTDGSSLWSPQPEYYKPDYVTSYHGDLKNKYGGSYSSPSLSSYGYNKDRLEGYDPLSVDHKAAYYNSGSVFDKKKPSYGSVPTHDYDSHYAYKPYGHAFNLDQYSGGKDLVKSVLIPLAGVALLGLAAALVVNPGLLHLGSLALGVAGKRKRRDVTANAHNLAYRAHLKQSQEATRSASSL